MNDLGTVIALGLIFSPFTSRTLAFVAISVAVFAALPFVTPWFFRLYGGRVSEPEAKYLLFFLFAMGGLAVWSGSEAVLPAYMIGMVLAGTVGQDQVLIRRLSAHLRIADAFYFIRAGSFVSVPALLGAPLVFVVLFFAKMMSKIIGLLPTVNAFKYERNEGLYYTPDDVYGADFWNNFRPLRSKPRDHRPSQYSFLVTTVIGSAVVPTMIANSFFMPRHLLKRRADQEFPMPLSEPSSTSAC